MSSVDALLRPRAPAVIAITTLIAGFFAYMFIGGGAWIVLLLMSGMSLADAMAGRGDLLADHLMVFLTGNAVGLFFGLGIVAVLVARLQSRRPWTFLRADKMDWRGAALSLLGLGALLPVVSWLGEVNERWPLPDIIRDLEESQMAVLESALASQESLLISLTLVAAAPALFEEVFFRGALQRNFEYAWGAPAGIIVTGAVFGLFHLRMSQLLPLIVLGVYLAYLAWCTGSLWVPILVHFANNALALIYHVKVKDQVGSLEAADLPWYVVVCGVVVLVGVLWVLRLNRKSHRP